MLYKRALELLEVPPQEASKLLKTYDEDLTKAQTEEKRKLVETWFKQKICQMAKQIMQDKPKESDETANALSVYESLHVQVPLSEFDRDQPHEKIAFGINTKKPKQQLLNSTADLLKNAQGRSKCGWIGNQNL